MVGLLEAVFRVVDDIKPELTMSETYLESFIRRKKSERPILLMSHAVVGYPSLAANAESVAAFVQAGVELIELQFPFSEPTADGPILAAANQRAVQLGTSVEDGFDLAAEMARKHGDVAFLIMTYYNIIFQHGEERFIRRAAASGIRGIIVPDLPFEASGSARFLCEQHGVSLIQLVTPDTSVQRLERITREAMGMIYCVARSGVTGHPTDFSPEFFEYIGRVRGVTHLPIGVGFGVNSYQSVQQLMGHADVAIVCTEAVRLSVEASIDEAARFLESIRQPA